MCHFFGRGPFCTCFFMSNTAWLSIAWLSLHFKLYTQWVAQYQPALPYTNPVPPSTNWHHFIIHHLVPQSWAHWLISFFATHLVGLRSFLFNHKSKPKYGQKNNYKMIQMIVIQVWCLILSFPLHVCVPFPTSGASKSLLGVNTS